MANPTTRAQERWQIKNGDDFLQLVNESGETLSWIDSSGVPQGNLAAGGGGTPGGLNGQIQFNNGGVFAGLSRSVAGANGSLIIATTDDETALTVFQYGPNNAAMEVVDVAGDNISFSCDTGTTIATSDSFGNSVSFATGPGSEAGFGMNDGDGGFVGLQSTAGVAGLFIQNADGHGMVLSPESIAFFNAAGAAQQTVTGVKLPSDTVIASLLAALVAYGLIVDATT